MARINLLPWREELRKKREKQFNMSAGIAVLLMLAVVGGVHMYNVERIEFQKSRNAFLEQQNALLNKRIQSIKNLDQQKANLLARMEIIQRLQSSRPEIVRVFDELVQTLPEGVYYESVQQKEDVLIVNGVAQSNAFVSSLMRNINNSPWLKDPQLKEIIANKNESAGQADLLRLAKFGLQFKQANTKSDDEDEDAG